eukprot:556441_1
MTQRLSLWNQSIVWALVAFAWYIVYQKLYKKYVIPRTNNQPDPLPTTFEPYIDIPTIDISQFYHQHNDPTIDHKLNISTQIIEASKKYGSFYISYPNHPIYNTPFRNKLISKAYKLFKIDPKLKQKYSSLPDHSRGYILYGKETGSRQYFEHKEGFCYGYHNWSEQHTPNNDMESHNVFPPIFTDNIEKSFNQLFDIFIEISYLLTKAYSIALYNDENILFNEFNGGETISIVRLFHYFSIKHSAYLDKLQAINTDNYLGSSPHTDWGLLTLIIADEMNGLQLLLNDKWYTVKAKFNDNNIFVNCGDFMSILSDGKFISPLHRVLLPMDDNNNDAERMSFVFFFYPQYDAKIPKSESKREYSLLKDQSKADIKDVFNVDMSFGSYIKEKWKQVTRS